MFDENSASLTSNVRWLLLYLLKLKSMSNCNFNSNMESNRRHTHPTCLEWKWASTNVL